LQPDQSDRKGNRYDSNNKLNGRDGTNVLSEQWCQGYVFITNNSTIHNTAPSRQVPTSE